MNAPRTAKPGQPRPDQSKPGQKRKATPSSASEAREGERIAKVIARAGICSRRDAERLIEEGKVSVNGKVLSSPAFNVTPRDRVTVDGEALPQFEPTRLWRYHKPAGLVTTAKDPEGRPTVFEHLPPDMPRVVSVGRLDINTEGLLLLTNDGELARLLELPATGWTRRYRVRAWGDITQADLDKLKDGIEVEGVRYGPVEAVLDKVQGSNVWLTVGLKEGKNREVKRVLGALGLTVNRLIRLSFGPFQIGDLLEGEVKQVPNRVLMDQLGAHGEAFKAKIDLAEDVTFSPTRKPASKAPAKKPGAPAGIKPAKAPVARDKKQDRSFGSKPDRAGGRRQERERERGPSTDSFFTPKKGEGGKSGSPKQKTRADLRKAGSKPVGGKAFAGKPAGGKPFAGKPGAGKPSGGGRPSRGKPNGKR